MSSFRPDFEPTEQSFAPIHFVRSGARSFAQSERTTAPESASRAASRSPSEEAQQGSEASGASGASGTSETSEASAGSGASVAEAQAEPAVERYSAEELALREQAAFERGAESAAAEAAQVDAAFRALEQAGHALRVAAATEPAINREQILELAALIASRWVAAELRDDAGRLAQGIDRAFESAGSAASARLLLHAEDRERLVATESGRLADWTTTHNVELATDPALDPGEFRIEMPRSIVDGRFSSIRQRLEEALAEALAAPRPEPMA